jgi:hypothetical protein
MKKSHTPFEKRSGRLIVVNGVKWKYTIGKDCIVAYSENGERKCEKCWIVRGSYDPDVYDRGQWKKTQDGMLTPSYIERWLWKS